MAQIARNLLSCIHEQIQYVGTSHLRHKLQEPISPLLVWAVFWVTWSVTVYVGFTLVGIVAFKVGSTLRLQFLICWCVSVLRFSRDRKMKCMLKRTNSCQPEGVFEVDRCTSRRDDCDDSRHLCWWTRIAFLGFSCATLIQIVVLIRQWKLLARLFHSPHFLITELRYVVLSCLATGDFHDQSR